MVCLSLELVGPWIVLGFSEGMEAFDEFLSIMFPGVRSAMAQEQPRGATPRLRPGAAPEAKAVTGSSKPTPEAGEVAGRNNPTSKEWWLCGCRRA